MWYVNLKFCPDIFCIISFQLLKSHETVNTFIIYILSNVLQWQNIHTTKIPNIWYKLYDITS
jgi:hypothetical protein